MNCNYLVYLADYESSHNLTAFTTYDEAEQWVLEALETLRVQLDAAYEMRSDDLSIAFIEGIDKYRSLNPDTLLAKIGPHIICARGLFIERISMGGDVREYQYPEKVFLFEDHNIDLDRGYGEDVD